MDYLESDREDLYNRWVASLFAFSEKSQRQPVDPDKQLIGDAPKGGGPHEKEEFISLEFPAVTFVCRASVDEILVPVPAAGFAFLLVPVDSTRSRKGLRKLEKAVLAAGAVTWEHYPPRDFPAFPYWLHAPKSTQSSTDGEAVQPRHRCVRTEDGNWQVDELTEAERVGFGIPKLIA